MSDDLSMQVCSWATHRELLSRIRHQVFVLEQVVPVAMEIDEYDPQARHWLAWVDGEAVATLRLLDNGSIGRMAVLAGYRRRGIGRALLQDCIEFARRQGHTRLSLAAQLHAIAFYEGCGFRPYGDEFMDAGIAHRLMALELGNGV